MFAEFQHKFDLDNPPPVCLREKPMEITLILSKHFQNYTQIWLKFHCNILKSVAEIIDKYLLRAF